MTNEQLLDLLDEAFDDLCTHPEYDDRQKQLVREGGYRHWCCQCSSYIRNERDGTLHDRVYEALKAAGKR